MDRAEYSRKMYDLKRGGLITYSAKHNIKLTDSGKRKLDFKRLEQLKWDSKSRDKYYRLIMFDIPEERRVVRDILRQKLREFECHQIQKSVYITQYRCEEIMEELIRLLNIRRHVHVMKIADLGHDQPRIAKRFKFG